MRDIFHQKVEYSEVLYETCINMSVLTLEFGRREVAGVVRELLLRDRNFLQLLNVCRVNPIRASSSSKGVGD